MRQAPGDAETQDGSAIRVYSKLLNHAVAMITGNFRRRMGAQLTLSRGGVLPEQQNESEFTELTRSSPDLA